MPGTKINENQSKSAPNGASLAILLIPMAIDKFCTVCEEQCHVNFQEMIPILPDGIWRLIKGGAV